MKFNFELIKQLVLKNYLHFLIIYLFSLTVIVLFWFKYVKIALFLVIILFNLNSLLHAKLSQLNDQCKDAKTLGGQLHNRIASFDWLQAIINQWWPGELALQFQKELNKFYIKNRKTEFKFYHFYLNENQPPKIGELYLPFEASRNDEIVLHLRVTIAGTVLLKLNEDAEQDKNELLFINLLIDKYGFKRKIQTGIYQDANLKKKNLLIKELYLNGRSRLIFRPLINRLPYFTSLSFQLLDYPILYANDKQDLFESSNEFEFEFYNYLIERICLPFLYPNRLILTHFHRDHIKHEHSLLFKQKLADANQLMQSKLRKLIKSKNFLQELTEQKLANWYRSNIINNLDLIELNLNCCTFHPFPLFILRIKLIEIENIVSNCTAFIRIRIGQLSFVKVRLINSNSPILNIITLLPVHDYYEQCTIQLLQIKSNNLKQIKKCVTELNAINWNQSIAKLPKDQNDLIRPIGECTFPIDRNAFDCDKMNSNLNGQDQWLPLNGYLKQSMIHFSCAYFKLSSSFKTIKTVSKITRELMITKQDLSFNQFPVAFVKIYIENFICTYKKDNKLKSRKNQFDQLQFDFFGQKKRIDLLKLTKTRLIFRNSCHFYAYDDPFNFDIVIELLDSKRNFKLDKQEDRIRLLNLVKLIDFKKRRAELYYNDLLPIYIVNNKDFNRAYANEKQKSSANFKLIDKEEFGKLTLNLLIRYVYLNNHTLERLLLAPEIRGSNLEANKKKAASRKKQTKANLQDRNRLLSADKKRKNLRTDQCAAKLYFKLINHNWFRGWCCECNQHTL